MEPHYFKDMLSALSRRSSNSTLSWLGFANVPLRRHLRDVFSRGYGDAGSFIGNPTFEAVFGWQPADATMADLAGSLLSEDLVDAMNDPPKDVPDEYRFPRQRRPYAHQLEAWRTLARPDAQSVVVASGTGSGKTECFMVPILDSLVREQKSIGGRLIGVRALFLYPLNALINSQRDRLRAWTSAFGGNIRFSLYNGLTPDVVRSADASHHPSEVLDRRTLRATPPPILVTNATMLEYMLVRTLDEPILQQSRGKLRWVVLDEAHTYIGSQAAEMALLIRRVLHSFDVDPEQVRFVATSATIGRSADEGVQQLRAFLSQLAGVEEDRVHVVTGSRAIPTLPKPGRVKEVNRDELWRINGAPGEDTSARYAALVQHPTALSVRDLFVSHDGPPIARLSDVCQCLFSSHDTYTASQQEEALDWLDLLATTTGPDRTPFLPLRAHIFHQTLSGLWACADIACPGKAASALSEAAWPFGQLYLAPRQHCNCGAPVYELVACEECGTVYLRADEHRGHVVQQRDAAVVDEFELEVEDDDSSDQEDADDTAEGASHGIRHGLLIANRVLPRTGQLSIARGSREIVEAGSPDSLNVLACEDGGDGLKCPACTGTSRRERHFRKARIGAPFLLGGILPTLLEYAPDGERPQDHPYRGRRLLTFSDSRQGTARLAAKLQQDAERTVMRGLIYHHVLRAAQGGAVGDTEQIEKDIADLEKALQAPMPESAKGPLKEMLSRRREELQTLRKGKPVSFEELQLALAQEGQDFQHILRAYQAYARDTFGGHDGARMLAGMLLVREFGRRPRRQNSLETMGLVALSYPKLEQITTSPAEWQARSFSTEDWRDFLKVAVDLTVRGGGSLDVPLDWRNWLGVRFSRNWLVAADKEDVARTERRWPQARRSGSQSPLVRLLAYLLKVDIESPYGTDAVDYLLVAAWEDLRRVGILSLSAAGYVLKLQDLAFRCMSVGWVCPVTRRFLDTAVRGVTPYLPRQQADATVQCERVDLPVYDAAFGGESDPLRRIQRARAWIANQPQLLAFREEGLWSDFNDRAIELSPYFSAAEHSAQQPAELLAKYEKAFKDGRLNLLSCSTTMEMGIDIGGVQIVAMNNVPPHPANYLQRAGRAGRRQETRSAAVTLCKSNPHDQTVFSNSRWAFDTQLPAPVISLNSSVIVQRHVNAMVLSQFLSDFLANSAQDLSKLSCGWFFESADTGPASRLITWCSAYRPGSHTNLEQGLRRLARHSVYEGLHPTALLTRVAEEMAVIADDWINEWSALIAQEGTASPADRSDPALKAIAHQKRRLSDEYLLRELATRGFLPAYGFPAFIASFDNMTVVEAKRLRAISGDGELNAARQDDNRYRRRDLASRDLITALREYAPGSEIVMNGLVYRSAGITLNWHMPADQQEARETQAIKFAWRCRSCGASGSSLSLEETTTCDACGASVHAKDIQQYLEPAGFSVDFYDEPHNDVSTQRFVPVERPWVSARGAWSSLPNPKLGRFRTSTDGRVYHHSSGANGCGYAICLVCGRAEPMLLDGGVPGVFADRTEHMRLRSRKDDRVCPGSANRWAIKEGIALGHEVKTDVLEVQLRDRTGQWLSDRVAATTLSVAMRDALAGLIGVQASELACDVKQALGEDDQKCFSILIFDRFAAGYSSGAHRLVEAVLRHARSRLVCPKNCDSACPSCVLDYDQRFDADSLDRHAALRVLTQEWFNDLRLPEEMCFLGEASRVEAATLGEGLLRESGRSDATLIRLFAGASVGECSFGSSPLRALAYRLSALSRNVEIVIARSTLEALDEADRYSLASLADHPAVSVRATTSCPQLNGGVAILAEVLSGQLATQWASGDAGACCLNEHWGGSALPIIVASGLTPTAKEGERLDSAAIRPKRVDPADREIVIHHQIDGNVQGFGRRFWDCISREHERTRSLLQSPQHQVVAIEYSDRYLFTPLSVALLLEVVAGLRECVGRDRWSNPVCKVTTTRARPTGESRVFGTLFADWPDPFVRDKVLVGAFEYLGMDAEAHVPDKQVVKHGRTLEVSFSNGESLTVRLDQGVSYWRVPLVSAGRRVNVSFQFAEGTGAGLATQIKRLAELSVPVEGAFHPTEVFVKARQRKTDEA